MGDFDESKHARDAQGRFASDGSEGAQKSIGPAKGLRAFANKHAEGDPSKPFATYGKAGNADKRGELVRTMGELKATVEAGKLAPGVNVGQHVKLAKEFLAQHNATLEQSVNELKKLAPDDAKVKGRTKDLHSALGKLVRKPKYGTAGNLQDGTGMRVITHSISEVEKTVDAIKANYKVVGEDNYIHQPQGDYRSHHLIIEDKHGLQKEIQVRTHNQNAFADWAHKVYKPENPQQHEALQKHGDIVAAYSKAMSDHFWRLDNGQKSERPATPHIVAKYFGEPK